MIWKAINEDTEEKVNHIKLLTSPIITAFHHIEKKQPIIDDTFEDIYDARLYQPQQTNKILKRTFMLQGRTQINVRRTHSMCQLDISVRVKI